MMHTCSPRTCTMQSSVHMAERVQLLRHGGCRASPPRQDTRDAGALLSPQQIDAGAQKPSSIFSRLLVPAKHTACAALIRLPTLNLTYSKIIAFEPCLERAHTELHLLFNEAKKLSHASRALAATCDVKQLDLACRTLPTIILCTRVLFSVSYC
jgi:hypothetical protein